MGSHKKKVTSEGARVLAGSICNLVGRGGRHTAIVTEKTKGFM